jgi:predicted nucleotidyltransferase component of viral defense system
VYLSPAQIKGRIKNVAKQNNTDPISLLRIYMMERFLERITYSKYKNDFIVKGGILVTSMIGISMRTTMDIDTTIRNFDLTKQEATRIINEIKDIPLDDSIRFFVNDVSDIMGDMEYPGIRIHMDAKIEDLVVPIKIDISTGDVITPREVKYEYPLLLEERTIQLWSYNLETILAEKIQTILSRSTLNTRMRDFYDVTTLFNRYKNSINYENLSLAFNRTCVKRETLFLLDESNDILVSIKADLNLQNLWKNYCKKQKYIEFVDFSMNIEILEYLIQQIKTTKVNNRV